MHALVTPHAHRPADVGEWRPIGELLRGEAGGNAMKGATLFSGIGAPEQAMPFVDWRWCAEIDPFASAVHAARFPHVVNHGDVAEIDADAVEPVDLIVFGSPCQSFSVAGRRLGLDDPRGNLALIALRLLGRLRPRWFVFENVPGLLSSDGGGDFGTLLGAMGELGYGLAYRVLDAQHFGVPQRRRRVFVVGHLGDWRAAAAVLFERESLSGHPAARREAGEGVALSPTLRAGGNSTGGHRPPGTDVDTCDSLIAHSLRAEGFDASEDGTGRGTPLVPVTASTLKSNNGGGGFGSDPSETFIPIAFQQNSRSEVRQFNGDGQIVGAIAADHGAQQQNYIAFQSSQSGVRTGEAHATLDSNNGSRRHNGVVAGSAVRRLTPREAERLQGFPDDFTLVIYRGKPAADGPRYRALGNSMAVPVVRWIGERLVAAHLAFEAGHDRPENTGNVSEAGPAHREAAE